MNKKYLILLFAVVSFPFFSESQVAKYSNEFLSIGVGARELAMGGAAVASTSSVFSTYWNPAALLDVKSDAQVGAMHNENFGGISKFDYIGFTSVKKDNSAIGFSMVRNGVDGIPNTLDLIDENGDVRYDRITTFSVNDYAFFVSAAQKLTDKDIVIGVNAKIIRRIVGKFATAWGFGIDLSAQYKTGKWVLAAMLRDATTTYNAWKFNTATFKDVFLLTGNEIPQNSTELTMPKLTLGGSKRFDIKTKHKILLEIDGDFTFDGKRNVLVKSKYASFDPKAGIEYGFKEIVFFRAGVNNLQKIPDFNNKQRVDLQPNLGAGFQYKKLAIDYALSILGDKSSAMYTNIFSLSYSFNKK
jgi:hypothetical protein